MARGLLTLMLAGCSGGKDDDPPIEPIDTEDPTTPTTDTGTEPASPDLVVLQEHVYTLSVGWTLESTDILEGSNVRIVWDALTTDAWGEPIDQNTIPVLALLEVLYPVDEVAEHLAADDLGSDLLSVWEADVTGEVSILADELAYETTPFDPVAFLLAENRKTWVVALGYRVGERLDIRTAEAIRVVAGVGEGRLDVTDESASVTWSGALDGTVLPAPAEAALYTVDWAGLTTDALGKPYDPYLGDVLFLGRFDGKAPADLHGDLLALEQVATAWYTMDVARETEARLDLARDGTGTVFAGFTAGSTWVMGVSCGTCLSPFPLWATVVDVQ